MSVRVVEKEFKIKDREKAVVVLEADDRGELEKPEVKSKAMEYARSQNFIPKGICNFLQIVPVDDNGEISEEMLHGKKPVKAYRLEIELAAGLSM